MGGRRCTLFLNPSPALSIFVSIQTPPFCLALFIYLLFRSNCWMLPNCCFSQISSPKFTKMLQNPSNHVMMINLNLKPGKVQQIPANFHLKVTKLLWIPANLNLKAPKVLQIPSNSNVQVTQVLEIAANCNIKVTKVLEISGNLNLKPTK